MQQDRRRRGTNFSASSSNETHKSNNALPKRTTHFITFVFLFSQNRSTLHSSPFPFTCHFFFLGLLISFYQAVSSITIRVWRPLLFTCLKIFYHHIFPLLHVMCPIDPRGRPQWSLYSHMLSVRPCACVRLSVRSHFSKSTKTKQIFRDCRLAEWIIDDSYLVIFFFYSSCSSRKFPTI